MCTWRRIDTKVGSVSHPSCGVKEQETSGKSSTGLRTGFLLTVQKIGFKSFLNSSGLQKVRMSSFSVRELFPVPQSSSNLYLLVNPLVNLLVNFSNSIMNRLHLSFVIIRAQSEMLSHHFPWERYSPRCRDYRAASCDRLWLLLVLGRSSEGLWTPAGII